jgi:N-hydroxyarylamine O-acetyltransferase
MPPSAAGNDPGLRDELIERVLQKLKFARRPEPTSRGLKAIYSAWCRRVPFDNINKMIHLRCRDSGSLPGDTAVDFFEQWIRFGAGGTCWAGNGALCVLLDSLGFAAERAVGTMVTAPTASRNHGSTVVECEGRRYVVDASILHDEPLLLDARAPGAVAHPAWGVQSSIRDGQWIIRWRPLHKPDGRDCRIEEYDAAAPVFRDRYENSRVHSPFNDELYVRLNRGDTVMGAAFGRRIEFDAAGGISQQELQGNERLRFLIEEIGIHEELAHALPQDMPPPPRPEAVADMMAG